MGDEQGVDVPDDWGEAPRFRQVVNDGSWRIVASSILGFRKPCLFRTVPTSTMGFGRYQKVTIQQTLTGMGLPNQNLGHEDIWLRQVDLKGGSIGKD